MARRITELVLRRDTAIGWLSKGPRNRYVDAAIHVLSDEPAAGQPGGPSRASWEIDGPYDTHRNTFSGDRDHVSLHTLRDRIAAAEQQPGPRRRQPLPPTSIALVGALTRRESEVARLVATGLSNKEIGVKLGLSPFTIKSHLSRALSRLELKNRTALTSYIHQIDDHENPPGTST